ncbi:zinc transporter 4 isoform X3 [Electrophorus electricus]|uniref:zinc transporter 4 isoform X3 n=1 Tax=Electrophorus electricus TaxID=8005 RepID=UPI0015D00618|nr:zinc transporter 4 isoform X3 [Electrophorus electricus]
MSSGNFISRVRSAFRKKREDWDLSDTATFDFSDELAVDETPRFNKLKVVVSGEMDDYSATASNGTAVNTFITDDDDSLLGSSSSLGSPGISMDPCENCTKRKEHTKQRAVMRKLAFAALLYFLFMVGELIGGYVANSLAIMTDALHMLTDLVGIVISLLALWLSAKPPTDRFTFGLQRLEVISAGISVLLIYILTGVLLNEAVQRTLHPDFTIDGDVMLITAAVGVAVNLIMGFLLNQSGHLHSHSHGPTHSHGHAHTERASGQGLQGHGSLAVRAAFIHALGDLVQSVGVLIAAYIVRFKPEYKLADPVCTYVFSVLVLVTTLRIIRDTGLILLEGVPRHLDVSGMKEDLLKLDDVESVQELKLWALTTEKTAAIAHLQLSKYHTHAHVQELKLWALTTEKTAAIAHLQLSKYHTHAHVQELKLWALTTEKTAAIAHLQLSKYHTHAHVQELKLWALTTEKTAAIAHLQLSKYHTHAHVQELKLWALTTEKTAAIAHLQLSKYHTHAHVQELKLWALTTEKTAAIAHLQLSKYHTHAHVQELKLWALTTEKTAAIAHLQLSKYHTCTCTGAEALGPHH